MIFSPFSYLRYKIISVATNFYLGQLKQGIWVVQETCSSMNGNLMEVLEVKEGATRAFDVSPGTGINVGR